jgi:hypothetical protein
VSQREYVETFDESAGGWTRWISNAEGPAAPERRDSAIVSRSPWWVDYNHAPPGGGYLHLLFGLQTCPHHNLEHVLREVAGLNRFIEGGFPTDFRDATLTLRLRGQIDLQGAQMVLHAQAKVGDVFVNQTLVGQPFEVTPDWSEQTVHLVPDPAQWKCLGSRHDRTNFYGSGPIEKVLQNLSNNIILVLYPLNVVSADTTVRQPHLLRAGEDYPIDRNLLPSGHVMLDEVRIRFAASASS